MAYEIDMLSVGNADAIVIRYINDNDEEYVVLIDAGHRGDGPKIEKHINRYTRSKKIDLAINTHPDDDHIGGFFYLVGRVPITKFWIHDPSLHKVNLENTLNEINKANLEKSLKFVVESLTDSKNLLSLIDQHGIERIEPFAGVSFEEISLKVVGPSIHYYESKLKSFRDYDVLLREEKALSMVKGIEEEWLFSEGIEEDKALLNKNNDRSNENNSSVVLLFEPQGRRYLFTADAGPEALLTAHNEYDLSNLNWLDVPHHGSIYNITSDLIEIFNPKVAYISCGNAKGSPSPSVVNVLKENGCKVYATSLSGNLLHNKIENRSGYSPATQL
ncbi:MBL fold metallo-hydrolase [Pontibacter rugosus]